MHKGKEQALACSGVVAKRIKVISGDPDQGPILALPPGLDRINFSLSGNEIRGVVIDIVVLVEADDLERFKRVSLSGFVRFERGFDVFGRGII